MASRTKKQNPWPVILILAAAIVLWALDHRQDSTPPAEKPRSAEKKSADPATPSPTRGTYEVFQKCTLAHDRSNDGDSFRVILPDGRRKIFRLYFVDAPESEFRTYRNGETNHPRIREQAQYFGISPEEAVEIGQSAKQLTLSLLGKAPFILHTQWDSPFNDRRYHAFITISDQGRPKQLHQLLVEKGLARIKTKPADLPDGTPASSHLRQLQSLERTARQARAGAWAP